MRAWQRPRRRSAATTGRRVSRPGVALALGILALLAAACGTGSAAGGGSAGEGLRDGRAGLELAGTFGGRQVAVRDGAPELVVGDCAPRTGPSQDVCVLTQTIGGETFVLAFANPDVLEAGRELAVGPSACRGAQCDDVAGHAIVDVQLGDERVRADAGEVRVQHVEEFLRYRAELRLELPDGRVSGHLDVVPRD